MTHALSASSTRTSGPSSGLGTSGSLSALQSTIPVISDCCLRALLLHMLVQYQPVFMYDYIGTGSGVGIYHLSKVSTRESRFQNLLLLQCAHG